MSDDPNADAVDSEQHGFNKYETSLTNAHLVKLEMQATSADDAVGQLASLLNVQGRVSDLEGFVAQVRAREHQLATGLPGGIGLPHARSQYVSQLSIAVGITKYGYPVDFGAVDGPANVVLLIGTPLTSSGEHLEVLATVAKSLSKESFRTSLRRANDAEVIAELINSSLVFADQ